MVNLFVKTTCLWVMIACSVSSWIEPPEIFHVKESASGTTEVSRILPNWPNLGLAEIFRHPEYVGYLKCPQCDWKSTYCLQRDATFSHNLTAGNRNRLGPTMVLVPLCSTMPTINYAPCTMPTMHLPRLDPRSTIMHSLHDILFPTMHQNRPCGTYLNETEPNHKTLL